MKLVEYRINKRKKDSCISAMSIVDKPAIEVNFVKLSKEEQPIELSINKDKQIISGPALIPDKKIYRSAESLGGEEGFIFFSAETIRKAAELFMENERMNNITLEHSVDSKDLKLIESWIVEDTNKDKSAFLGFNVPKGTWMISYKVNNSDLWNKIKAGEFNGFSIEADHLEKIEMKEETPLTSEEIEEIKESFVQDGITKQDLIEEGFLDETVDNSLDLTEDIADFIITKLKEHLEIEVDTGETEKDFIARCIPFEMKKGHDQQQSAAICYSKWNNK